jgi:hypothetical protein
MSQSAPPAPTSAPPPEPPVQQNVRRSVAAAILAAAVVLGIVVVGVVIRFNGDRLPTGPPLPPPTPTPVGLQFETASREASYLNVKVMLAGPPYLCADRPQPMSPFEQAAPCSLMVHQSYDGSNSWQAVTGLALVPDSLNGSDAKATARAVFARIVQTQYPKGHASVSKLEVEPYETIGDAALLTAHVDVDVPKLPTTYDAVVIVVLTAKDGEQVTFFSLKPNDAGDQALAALRASANTLTTAG